VADDVTIDDAAVADFLNGPGSPVEALLEELSERAALVARAKVRVRIPGTDHTGRTSNARPPGFTKASIHITVNRNATGELFGGVGAAEDPSIFLEEPAEQEREFPFLTTGLDSLEI
jgi:hypothetical protein